jgi:excisionase family DNA binding protein
MAHVEDVKVEYAKVAIGEAVRLTGLNPQTIYRLAREGRVGSFRVLNRSVRFDRSDLLKLLEARTKNPPQQSKDRPSIEMNA